MSVEHFVIPQMPEAMPLAARDREKGSYGVCCWTPPRPHSPAGRRRGAKSSRRGCGVLVRQWNGLVGVVACCRPQDMDGAPLETQIQNLVNGDVKQRRGTEESDLTPTRLWGIGLKCAELEI